MAKTGKFKQWFVGWSRWLAVALFCLLEFFLHLFRLPHWHP